MNEADFWREQALALCRALECTLTRLAAADQHIKSLAVEKRQYVSRPQTEEPPSER